MWSSGHRVDEPLSSVERLEVNWHEERSAYKISRAPKGLGFRVRLLHFDADHMRSLVDDARGVSDEAATGPIGGVLRGVDEQCSRVSPPSYPVPRLAHELGMVSGGMGGAARAPARCHQEEAAAEQQHEEPTSRA